MGSALLEGWLGLGVDPAGITVIEPQPIPEISALAARGLRLNPTALPSRTDAVVIAVKPQTAPEALAGIAGRIAPGAVVISIMAGRTHRLSRSGAAGGHGDRARDAEHPRRHRPRHHRRGAECGVTPAQRDLAHRLLAATGAVEWVDDEALMDAVTAVSGSGPAYIFLLAESLARAGEKAGLPAALAASLARATVAGAGELLHRSPLDPATLRHNVTSPGGTTAAALEVLMSADGLDPLMERAIAAATRVPASSPASARALAPPRQAA